MAGKTSKPNLAGLRCDYRLPEDVKQKFGLSNLLKTNAGSWTDVKALIDAYFSDILVWEESGEEYLQAVAEALYRFSQSDAETEKARSYAKNVSMFLSQRSIISKGAFYYKLKAAEAETRRHEVLAKLQGAATGSALSNLGAVALRKRAFDEVFGSFDENNDEDEENEENEVENEEESKEENEEKSESSFMIKKNSHYYNMHTPSKKYFVSPQKPIIQNADRTTCSEYFDIHLSTDVFPKCSDILENEYETHMKNMKVNSSLQSALGESYLEFVNNLFTIDMSNFSKEIFTIDHTPNNPFVEFLKQSYNDLCICWNDPRDYYQSGERTLLAEVFIQQFKLFSKMTKLLYFKWVEKKLNNTDHIWLTKKDFVKREVQLKLLDGIGILKNNDVNFIMLESSGVVDNVYTHTLEDKIKNLKHGSDSLASILCGYSDCNVETAKQIVVLTGHIIKDKLTIMKYSPGDSCKWAAVETRSCTIPLTYERRKEAIKLFEVFAYIYLTLKEQEKVYDSLNDEKLGLKLVNEEDMVRNSASFL